MAQIHRITYRFPDRHPDLPMATHDLHCPKVAATLAHSLRERGYDVTLREVWA